MNSVKKSEMVLPSLLSEIFKPDWFGGLENKSSSVPAVNVKDNEKDFELDLAVPGMKKDDFNIEVDNNVLTISAEVKSSEEEGTGKYTRKEFAFASFKRSFNLPKSIDADNITADYENGILKLTLPKKEEALPKPKRSIVLS